MSLFEDKQIHGLCSNVKTRVQHVREPCNNDSDVTEISQCTRKISSDNLIKNIFKDCLIAFLEFRNYYLSIGFLPTRQSKKSNISLIEEFQSINYDEQDGSDDSESFRKFKKYHDMKDKNSESPADYFYDEDSYSEETIESVKSKKIYPAVLSQYFLGKYPEGQSLTIRCIPEKPKIYSIGLYCGFRTRNNKTEETDKVIPNSQIIPVLCSCQKKESSLPSVKKVDSSVQCSENSLEFDLGYHKKSRRRHNSRRKRETIKNNIYPMKLENKGRKMQKKDLKSHVSRKICGINLEEVETSSNDELEIRRETEEFIGMDKKNSTRKKRLKYVSTRANGAGDSASIINLSNPAKRRIATHICSMNNMLSRNKHILEAKIAESEIMENIKRRIHRDFNSAFSKGSDIEDISELYSTIRSCDGSDETNLPVINHNLERRKTTRKKYHVYNKQCVSIDNMSKSKEMTSQYSYPLLNRYQNFNKCQGSRKEPSLPLLSNHTKTTKSLTFPQVKTNAPQRENKQDIIYEDLTIKRIRRMDISCRYRNSNYVDKKHSISENVNNQLNNTCYYSKPSHSKLESGRSTSKVNSSRCTNHVDSGVMIDYTKNNNEIIEDFYENLERELNFDISPPASSRGSEESAGFDFFSNNSDSDESIYRRIDIAVEELTENLILYEKRFNDKQRNKKLKCMNNHRRTKQWLADIESYSSGLLTPSLSLISDSEAEAVSQIIKEETFTK